VGGRWQAWPFISINAKKDKTSQSGGKNGGDEAFVRGETGRKGGTEIKPRSTGRTEGMLASEPLPGGEKLEKERTGSATT